MTVPKSVFISALGMACQIANGRLSLDGFESIAGYPESKNLVIEILESKGRALEAFKALCVSPARSAVEVIAVNSLIEEIWELKQGDMLERGVRGGVRYS